LANSGEANILAWKYAQGLSYSFSHLKIRPVPSLLFGISSGDANPASPDLQTFYPLFPKGLYYGFIDDSGSLNAIVLHERIALQIAKKVSPAPDNFFFWRQRTTDGLYSQPGVLLRSGLASQKILRLLGQLITTRQFSCWARTTKPEPFCEKLLRQEGTRGMYLEK
jgi:hypothetical protein